MIVGIIDRYGYVIAYLKEEYERGDGRTVFVSDMDGEYLYCNGYDTEEFEDKIAMDIHDCEVAMANGIDYCQCGYH